jgi:hypothetical protein
MVEGKLEVSVQFAVEVEEIGITCVVETTGLEVCG